ncbi:hypothetical protein SAY87_006717 [Trapa incisa]|uniref:MYB transcription factor n=1 Tax=Trapa incisa TaxID=236973 RepID=A0AAN7Q4D1_9MYRT|nr:hypothetical protein SAY87_006717 [Trapa incisa]
MSRRCSYCGNMGHNSRTCTSSSPAAPPAARSSPSPSSAAGGGLKLFGVQLQLSATPAASSSSSSSSLMSASVDCNSMKKSFSMDCLSSKPPVAATTPSPLAPSLPTGDDRAAKGYNSDGLLGRLPEKKKGVPWSEEEHRGFLLGLEKLGRGDWRGISRNFVRTRTPTQVASHAQKYFLRQNAVVSAATTKRRCRPSLFDDEVLSLKSHHIPRPHIPTAAVPELPSYLAVDGHRYHRLDPRRLVQISTAEKVHRGSITSINVVEGHRLMKGGGDDGDDLELKLAVSIPSASGNSNHELGLSRTQLCLSSGIIT